VSCAAQYNELCSQLPAALSAAASGAAGPAEGTSADKSAVEGGQGAKQQTPLDALLSLYDKILGQLRQARAQAQTALKSSTGGSSGEGGAWRRADLAASAAGGAMSHADGSDWYVVWARHAVWLMCHSCLCLPSSPSSRPQLCTLAYIRCCVLICLGLTCSGGGRCFPHRAHNCGQSTRRAGCAESSRPGSGAGR
jgi:hypothetical protein